MSQSQNIFPTCIGGVQETFHCTGLHLYWGQANTRFNCTNVHRLGQACALGGPVWRKQFSRFSTISLKHLFFVMILSSSWFFSRWNCGFGQKYHSLLRFAQKCRIPRSIYNWKTTAYKIGNYFINIKTHWHELACNNKCNFQTVTIFCIAYRAVTARIIPNLLQLIWIKKLFFNRKMFFLSSMGCG